MRSGYERGENEHLLVRLHGDPKSKFMCQFERENIQSPRTERMHRKSLEARTMVSTLREHRWRSSPPVSGSHYQHKVIHRFFLSLVELVPL